MRGKAKGHKIEDHYDESQAGTGTTQSTQSSNPTKNIAQHQKEDEQIIALNKKLDEIQSSKGLIDHSQRAQIISQIGRLHCDNQEYEKAFESHYEAMEILASINANEDDIRIAICLRDIGDVHYSKNELSDAIDSYMDSLKMTRAVQEGDEHKHFIGSLLLKLGNVSYDQNDVEIALPSLELARNAFEGSFDHVYDYAEVSELIGHIQYDDLSRYEDAVKSFKKALAARKNGIYYKEPDENVQLLEEYIITINRRMGKFTDKSMSTLKRIMKDREQKYGKCSIEVASSLVTLAKAYSYQEKYDTAMDLLLKALSIQKEFLPNDDNGNCTLGKTLDTIGNVHKMKGDIRYAMSAYADALELKEKCNLDEDPRFKCEIALTLFQIGEVHEMNEHFDEAMQLLGEALFTQQSLLIPEHLDVAATKQRIAIIHGKLQQYQDAMENHVEVLRIYNKILGPNHMDVSESLCYIGDIHSEWGEFDKAICVFEKAQTIQEENLKSCNAEDMFKIKLALASTLNKRGMVLEKMGNNEDAVSCYKQSLENYRSSGVDGNFPGVKEVLSRLGTLDKSFEVMVHTALSWAGFLAPDVSCTDGSTLENMTCFTTDLLTCASSDEDSGQK